MVERLDRARGEELDPVDARRVEILYRRFLGEQVAGVKEVWSLTDSLSQIQIRYRARYQGGSATNNELMRVLRFEEDRSLREEAWNARYGVGNEKAQGLIDLVHLRNEEARKIGYPDFYAYRMDVIGIDEMELVSLLTRLRDLSEIPYRRFEERLKERIGADRLEPWDLRFAYDPVRNEIERFYPKSELGRRVHATFLDVGLDIDLLPITVDAEPRPGKSQHAYSFPIDPPGDVRILTNADDGLASATTLLHEMGHAVHSALIDQPFFTLRSPPSKSVSEGIANFFGILTEDPEWQTRYASIPAETIARFERYRREQAAFEMRRMLLYIFTEREIYRKPEGDPHQIYWSLAHDLLHVNPLHDTAAWAHLIHYTTHPVYYQNYLIADLIAAHLAHHMRERAGGIVGEPETGRFLRDEIFVHGARYRWDELIERATGEPLRADYYVEEWLR